MKLNDEERQIMVSLEYEKAQSFFEQAEKIAAMDLWDVVNTHKGTLVMFGQNYVKTGIFPTDASKLYVKLQMMREESDYNCVYVTTADEMQPLFEPVREFISKVGNLIKD